MTRYASDVFCTLFRSMWFGVKKRRKRVARRSHATEAHYRTHRERARALVHERLEHWSTHYECSYGRVAIRDQRTRWGSCSSKQNLNFNYRIIFLPPHLADYIIVHEVCHLLELNHGPQFWALVARACPEYVAHIHELRSINMYTLTS